MRNIKRTLVLTISIIAMILAFAPAVSAQESNEVLSLEEQWQLPDDEERAYFDALAQRAADIRYNSEVARDSNGDSSAVVVNYCEYEANEAECNEGFAAGREVAFGVGLYDGKYKINREAPAPRETFPERSVSFQRGYTNGIVVGYYHGAAVGLGQGIAYWEGINDCLTNNQAIANVETWVITLLYSETVDEQLFAARVIEGYAATYVRGYQLCQSGDTERMEAIASLFGELTGASQARDGNTDPWYGYPERIDEDLAELWLEGFEDGQANPGSLADYQFPTPPREHYVRRPAVPIW